MKQQAFEHGYHSYKDKVTEQFTSIKEQFNTEYKQVLEDVHMLKTEVFNVTPRLDDMQLTCEHLTQALKKEDARFELLQNKIIQYETSKVDSAKYHEDNVELKHTLG
jgi:hypothetical protein